MEKKKEDVFNKIFEKASISFPELKGVLDKETIKRLAFDKENSDKTVKQLIEKVYGGVIGKKEEEPSPSFEKGGVGAKTSTLDFANLSAEDHKLIKGDPKLAEEYGDWVVKNVSW